MVQNQKNKKKKKESDIFRYTSPKRSSSRNLQSPVGFYWQYLLPWRTFKIPSGRPSSKAESKKQKKAHQLHLALVGLGVVVVVRAVVAERPAHPRAQVLSEDVEVEPGRGRGRGIRRVAAGVVLLRRVGDLWRKGGKLLCVLDLCVRTSYYSVFQLRCNAEAQYYGTVCCNENAHNTLKVLRWWVCH